MYGILHYIYGTILYRRFHGELIKKIVNAPNKNLIMTLL